MSSRRKARRGRITNCQDPSARCFRRTSTFWANRFSKATASACSLQWVASQKLPRALMKRTTNLRGAAGVDARASIADLGSVGHLPRRHLGPPLPTVDRRSHRDHRPRVAELIASDLRKVHIKVVLTRRATSRPIATGFDDGRSLVTCATRRRRLARQPEPPTLVLNEPSCYHFRALDSRVSAVRSSTMNVGGNNRPLFPHLSVAAW